MAIMAGGLRKWIVGGAVALGGVALLSTGFATWIIGAQNTLKENGTLVNVDTGSNEFVEFDFEIDPDKGYDNLIYLKEDSETYNEYENKKANDTVNFVTLTGEFEDHPLQIRGEISISAGKDYLEHNTLTGIDFAIVPDLDDEGHPLTTPAPLNQVLNANNLLTNEDGKIGSAVRASKGEEDPLYTYFDAPSNVTFEGLYNLGGSTADADLLKKAINISWDLEVGNTAFWNSITKTGTTVTVKKVITFDFRWGSYFGGQSPYHYYEAIDLSTRNRDQRSNVYGLVTEELNRMHDQLNEKAIKLNSSLKVVNH